MAKVLVAPTIKIGHYWAKSMRILPKIGSFPEDIKILTPDMSFFGITEVYAYIYEEPFDFPETKHPEFTAYCEAIEAYLEGL